MNELEVNDFRQAGLPEYVLLKAGLVQISSAPAGGEKRVTGGAGLPKMFREGRMPPLEEIVPPIKALVMAHALEPSGFIATDAMRLQAVSELDGIGMTNQAIASLGPLIEKAAAEIRQEMARAKKAFR